jgi:apolipoprotein N-acyltransferase
MASANITLGPQCANIETGSTQYVATLTGNSGTITNIGSVDIEIGWNGFTISTAGVQGQNQTTLKVGMTVPVEMMSSFSFMSASAGLIGFWPYRR